MKIFPNASKIIFKEKFIERYSKWTDFNEFRKYSLSFLRKSIRVNTLKITVEELKARLEKDWQLTPIPFCREGFWIEGKRRDVGNLPEHVLGYIYVQEAASMIPPVVLDPRHGEIVLDMAAAPGSKTTQLAQYMNNKGLIVANDIDPKRLRVLEMNCQRCGATNVVRTNMHGYRTDEIKFDKILLDAPCSGIGTIRKSVKTINMWNPNMVKKIAGTQRKLIETAFEMLKPGGEMVYSTCTLEPEENEGIVDFLLKKYPEAKVMPIKLDIKRSECILEFEGRHYDGSIKDCLRIWPQDNDTEGFFVARIGKSG